MVRLIFQQTQFGVIVHSFLKLILTAGLACISALSFAASNPLSVHILDLQTGQPMPGVTVTLEQKKGSDWKQINSDATNEQGRIVALYPANQALSAGIYRVIFKTGKHYAQLNQKTFFVEIPVEFNIDKVDEHYHIPLLLSPYGYSTYRGN
jgi:5-hydroxyisourate hydrolase